MRAQGQQVRVSAAAQAAIGGSVMRIEIDKSTGDARWRAFVGNGRIATCSGTVAALGGGRWRAGLDGGEGRSVDADDRESACRAVVDALIALHASAGRVELSGALP